jgi:hypothetical protein
VIREFDKKGEPFETVFGGDGSAKPLETVQGYFGGS